MAGGSHRAGLSKESSAGQEATMIADSHLPICLMSAEEFLPDGRSEAAAQTASKAENLLHMHGERL
jgi:hypothetical protein